MHTFKTESSVLAYGVMDQVFSYCGNLALLAGFAGVMNMVSSHPGFFFRPSIDTPVLLFLSILLGFLVMGGATLFAHRTRTLFAARFGPHWTRLINRAYMGITTIGLFFTGYLFVYEAMSALKKFGGN